MKKCPYCAEEIQDEAIVCRYCGRELQNIKNHSVSNNIQRDIRGSGQIILDVLLIGASIALVLINRLPIWPGMSTRIAMNFGMSELMKDSFYLVSNIYSVLVWIALLFSLLTIVLLVLRESFPGWLWIILAVVMSIYPIIGVNAASSGLRSEFFWDGALGYVVSLILILVIFLLGLVKTVSSRNFQFKI